MKNYVIGEKNRRCVIVSEKEIIENALQQEKDGVKPHYSFYDYKNGEKVTPNGWLVWSSLNYGCGVVYRRKDEKMIISIGAQGDFTIADFFRYPFRRPARFEGVRQII